MNTETGYAALENGRVYYEAAGVGPAVVFVHGFALDTRMWDDQFEVFARQYRVIRFDIRGHGRSPAPSGPYARTDDIKGLLDRLGGGRGHIIGLSMGGGIALDFAITYPEQTLSLIAVDSALGGFPYTTNFNMRARADGLSAAKARWLAHDFFKPVNRDAALAGRLRQMVTDWSGWEWFNYDPGRIPDPLPYHRLHEVRAPALVVVGELDIPDFRAIADYLTHGISGARQVVLPGVGHLSNMEAPDAFNQAVLNFLGQVSAV
jgi:3-oxoadipate enol-lactonase